MPNKQVQIRRSSESSLIAAVPADGEMAFNTTKKRFHVGDGIMSGGIPHLNYDDAQGDFFVYGADIGTTNAYAIDLPYDPTSFRAGLKVKIKIGNTNTGPSTLTITGLSGSKNIYKYTAGTLGNLAANDLIGGGVYELVYDGTQFQLQTYTNAGIVSVGQGDLRTSVQSVTGPGSAILSGGEYGFWVLTGTNAGAVGCFAAPLYNNGSASALGLAARIQLTRTSGSGLIPAYQRYITSSPPFDLGEGDVGGFFFAVVNEAGEVVQHSLSDVPPWAYNGPTSVRADRVCPTTGKKFKRVMVERTIEEIMDGAKILYKEQEITHAIKNADMGLIPHPFGEIAAGHKIVLLDTMDERLRSAVEYQNLGGGEDIVKAISEGKILVDVDKVSRRGAKCPKGVAMHKLKFKYSKGK